MTEPIILELGPHDYVVSARSGYLLMDRRAFLGALGLLAAPVGVDAQPGDAVQRIGWLGLGSRETAERNLQAFEQALRESGWTIGRNVVIDYRWAEGKYDRLPAMAAELVQLEPKVIVAGAMVGVRAARNATSTIPIVMTTVTDPVGEGLIVSFGHPGGNVTGVTQTPTWELYGKQLELLLEFVPRARRIAFLWNPANVAAPPGVQTAEEAARKRGVALQVVGARTPEEFAPAFGTMTQGRAQALLVLPDPMFFMNRRRLADLAGGQRLPAMFGAKEFVEAGALMSYATSYPDQFHRAGIYVDKILRGAKPADLPVEQATKFEFVINLRTARALGLTIPPSLLLLADQVIE